MKVFIREYCRDAEVTIYGIDGEDHTKDFFEKYFLGCRDVYRTTEEERTEYHSKAEFTVVKADHFNYFAENLGKIQNAIDIVAEALMRGESIDNYTFNGKCYIMGELKSDRLAKLENEINAKKEKLSEYTNNGGLEQMSVLAEELKILSDKAAKLKEEIFINEFMKKVTYNEDRPGVK